MTRSSREFRPDSGVQQVLDILARYDDQHPNAKIDAYRQNSASIRLRIIDPEFEPLDRVQREEWIWDILDGLPEGIQSQITLVLLLTAKEASFSFANFEFENPLPSNLSCALRK
jgi:hypothetical protein